MEKSLELFAENGFEATSVQQITERCGISKGAFYLHFKSKDELINSLIDDFMTRFITSIEHAVSPDQPNDELLYNYLYVMFKEFQEQASFAKIFLQEQVLSFNGELLSKVQIYTTMLNKMMSSVVQRQFPNLNPNMHLDVVFSVNGLVKGYAELFLIDNYKVELQVLCNSIVEKVSIIAEHAKVQAVTLDYLRCINLKASYSKEHILELIDSILHEMKEDSIVYESLQLLKEHLHVPSLRPVLLQGLLKNIKEYDQCKWVAYLYQLYLQSEE